MADLENCKLPLGTRPAGEHGFGHHGFRGCHLVQVFANGTVISAAVGGKRMTNPQSGSQWGFGLEPSEPPGREGLGGRLARTLGMGRQDLDIWSARRRLKASAPDNHINWLGRYIQPFVQNACAIMASEN
jgi:hypothetical protein